MSKPYDPRDPFYKRAKQEGFRARSAYKLQEIARRFALFKKGQRVLDLGAAPGGCCR
jgi:23S rRNA (uridine2552-2'-O)-methyltransferase